MKFLFIEPFVPSGSDFETSKSFFQELGFTLNWEQHGMAGFQRDECRFILQQYDNKEFAENLMLSIKIDNAEEFRNSILSKRLVDKYHIRVSRIIDQLYGKEVNVIDPAGVCWHFIEQ